jgi:hypothetical protein
VANAVKTKNDQVSQIDGILKSAQAENKSDADSDSLVRRVPDREHHVPEGGNR